jgi:hypothetical protein
VKQIQASEIRFENLDWIRIPPKYFGRLSIRDLSTRLDLCGAHIAKHFSAGTINFELLPSAEKDALTFSGEWRLPPVFHTLLQRLQQQDISAIILKYEDNEDEEYWVSWADDPHTDTKNRNQQVKKACDGNYIVTILPQNADPEESACIGSSSQ